MKKITPSLFLLSTVFWVSKLGIASFTDIPGNHPNFDAISYAETEGIVEGYSDGTFQPLVNINRAEFTKIIIGYTALEDEIRNCFFTEEFPDVGATDWFSQYICHARGAGIINGYPDGTFKPRNPISFAEAAKIIVLASGASVSSSSVWYEPYVDYVEEHDAKPESISAVDKLITRAEMVEIIYRLREEAENGDSSNDEISDGNSPLIGSCPVFPADNPWNTDISDYPVHLNSDAYISSIGRDSFLHADFGGNGEYGIPFITVDSDQEMIDINFTAYGDESDPGPYPIPLEASIQGGIESGGDRHVLAIDTDSCMLYELYHAFARGNSWDADSGAVYDLRSNALRPDYWTSADAAGLPIFPGLVRYDEVANGEVTHALRFTVETTQRGFIHPATHFASSETDENLPPMGLRVRLKRDYDISGFTGEARVILEGLKKYGMIVADNGSDWFITGAADTRWDDEDLNQLKPVPGSAFEAVDTGEIIH